MTPRIQYVAPNPSVREKIWYFKDWDWGSEEASHKAALALFEQLRATKGEAAVSGRKYLKTKTLSLSRHHIVDAAIWAWAVVESPASASHQEWVKP